MAVIRHAFTNPQADVADPTICRPSDWNQSHLATLLDAVSLAGNTAGVLANISSGTLILAGGNNITLSQAANAVTISAAATVAQSVQTESRFNLTVGGNTAGALALISSGVLTLAGGNNVTLSQAGNAVTVSGVATVAQTEQTQSRFNLTLGGNTSGALALVSSGVLTLAGGDNITLSQAGNAVTVVAAGGTGGGVPIATTVQSVGSANSVGTVTRYAPEDHVHAGAVSVGMSNLGNTAGVSGVRSNLLVLVGGNNVTLSQSVNAQSVTVTISAANTVAQTEQTQSRFNLTLGGNTAGALALISSGVMTLAGGDNITLSQAGNAVTVVGPSAAGGGYASRWMFPDKDITSISTFGQGSQTVCWGNLGNNLTASKMCFYGSVNIANAANNSSAFLDISILFGLYTRSAATLFSLTTLTTLFSTSWSSNLTGSVAGVREFSVPINLNLPPNEYYLLLNLSTTNTGAGANTTALGNTITLHGGGNVGSINHFVPFGVSTTASRNLWSGMGIYSVTSAALPDEISVSGIAQSGTAMQRANLLFDFRLKD